MYSGTKPRSRRRVIDIPPPPKKRHVFARLVIFLIFVIAVVSGGFYVFDTYKAVYLGTAIPEIKSGIADTCLDLRHNDASPGAEVDAATCDGRPSQNWTSTNTTIVHDGFCLSAPGSPVATDAKIVVEKCDGSVGQVWLSSYLDSFENPSSGQCLDIPSGQADLQLTAGPCDDLAGLDETWSASTWSRTNTSPAAVNCDFGSEGEQIGCVAAKQWVVWNNGTTNHSSLLNTYSDGNSYEEWCADFVSYVYKTAGYPLTGGERVGWDEYVASDVRYDGTFTYQQAGRYMPQPGDVAYFDYPGGHVEIVLLGGARPVFVYGDSGKIDKSTGNGDMAENDITQDGSLGRLAYYLTF